MASSKGQVTLRGRFSKGSVVTLTRVAGEHSLRPEGGETIETKTVEEKDGAGFVRFTKGVEVGARYFIHGLEDGRPLEVRARGRAADDESEVLAQPPVGPERVRLADGSFSDEKPTAESPPGAFVGPGPSVQQVPDGVQLRSATFRGEAHPVADGEKAPYRDQRDVPEGTQQASDTRPRELEDGTRVGGGGLATEIVQSIQRQDQVPAGVQQRSDTVAGQAMPVPLGNAVDAQLARESAIAKETRGDTSRAAAEPLEQKKPLSKPRDREEAVRPEPAQPDGSDSRVNVDGKDAQGQPVDPAVAAAAGLARADLREEAHEAGASKTEGVAATAAGERRPSLPKPSGKGSTAAGAKKRSEAAKKAAATRKKNAAKKK